MSAYIVVKESVVYHYGVLFDLAPQVNRGWHHEGNTFSVSLSPSEWFKKFPCNERDARLFELKRRDQKPARFIDLYRLSAQNRDEINAWAERSGLGQLERPDLLGLGKKFGQTLTDQAAYLAIQIAWADDKGFDGIWFTEQIGEDMPLSGRGGILQTRLNKFIEVPLGPVSEASFPEARLPQVILEVH